MVQFPLFLMYLLELPTFLIRVILQMKVILLEYQQLQTEDIHQAENNTQMV